jgi:endonuclease YncB( thermonuclease family)
MRRAAGWLLPVGAAALVLAVATALLRLPWLENAIEAMFDTGSFAGAAAAIDGDTLDVGGRRVRLAGIDAPELAQSCADSAGQPRPCGRQVRAALAEFIGADVVTCRPVGRDRFDRVLAACAVRGRDLSAWLVSGGLAVAYAGPGGDPFRAAEAAARAAGAGLWAGGFDRPVTWRRRRDP